MPWSRGSKFILLPVDIQWFHYRYWYSTLITLLMKRLFFPPLNGLGTLVKNHLTIIDVWVYFWVSLICVYLYARTTTVFIFLTREKQKFFNMRNLKRWLELGLILHLYKRTKNFYSRDKRFLGWQIVGRWIYRGASGS